MSTITPIMPAPAASTQSQNNMVGAIDKLDIAQLETVVGDDASLQEEKKTQGKVDYSGFAQKTDPKEIKLVRKLDRYIMVSIYLAGWIFCG
jgi:hypothetical protein